MELVVHNKIVDAPVVSMLRQLRDECPGLLRDIDVNTSPDYVRITCPFHKGGNESHPSCSVYSREDNPSIYKGTYHCFTCGEQGSFFDLVGKCLGGDEELGEDWVDERFANVFADKTYYIAPLKEPEKQKRVCLDEGILAKYNFFHPYMFQRGLDKNVIQTFRVGYDPETDCLTFPVWDDRGNLVAITRRSASNKRFNLETGKDKEVYLLNFVKKWNFPYCYVCESQINALTLWGYGYPAVALFGTGSKEQYDILNRSGISTFILALDPDMAGDSGTKKLIYNLKKDIIVNVLDIPRVFKPDGKFKDINDFTKDEIKSFKLLNKYDWLKLHNG